ncbi:MAG: ATP-binding protein, partial [Synechococcales bacterium]|nr:ATP-binding protein [Synechococcales bacterium]
MMLDSSNADESYAFFLTEAQDLLTTIEQDLFNLKEECTPAKLHSLMRAAHTLKGAAASVEREAIKKVAHVLEDVFNALYSPNARIDETVEALLFEGYECLRLLFHAEFTGGTVDESAILNRAATVIARLQELLGDCFNSEPALPTSAELGFDLVESMFKSGVAARLDRLRQVLAQGHARLVGQELQTQAEVLLGLAESLNLPGFGAIAQTTIRAIKAHPKQILQIATVALADWEQGQAAVLGGDRTQGGSPSATLCQLAQSGSLCEATEADAAVQIPTQEGTEWSDDSLEGTDLDSLDLDSLDLDSLDLDSLNLDAIDSDSLDLDSLDSDSLDSLDSDSLDLDAIDLDLPDLGVTAPDAPPEADFVPPATSLSPLPPPFKEATAPQTVPTHHRPRPSRSQSVRISVEKLHRLDHAAGELLTHQTQQHREADQLRLTTQTLLNRLQAHLATLQELQSWSGQVRHRPVASPRMAPIRPALFPAKPPGSNGALRSKVVALSPEASFANAPTQVFDALELDEYSEVQVLSQRALDEAISLEALVEALSQTLKQSKHNLQTQRQVLKDVQDDITSARMQSLGDLLQRFHRTLQQLVVTYGKQVTLDIQGSDVLVDRVIVEKLYDPILHLIRNAFDHGIEPPEVRRSLGKPEVGCIQIRAFNRGCYTVVEVEDDGAGIDPQTIVQRALQLGFVTPEQVPHLGQADIFALLFQAGFSTTSSLSDLSGRGVGLDVVRSQMADLQGDVSLQSTRHRGTTFALRVPLSLSIQPLLLLEAGGQVYALPADTVERVVIPQAHQLQVDMEQTVTLQLPPSPGGQDGLVRVYSLAQHLTYSPVSRAVASRAALQAPDEGLAVAASVQLTPVAAGGQALPATDKLTPIILLHLPSGRRGLQAERILGEQELVIRPLDPTLSPPAYLHGCCVLGNQLALVIDPVAFVAGVATAPAGPVSTTIHPPTLPPATLAPERGSLTGLGRSSSLLPGSTTTSIPLVLVVDDSATVRHSLSTILRQGGYQVLQASDGVEALSYLHQHPQVNAIICDIEMPQMNGFQFL